MYNRVRKKLPDEALLEQRLDMLRLRFEPPYLVAIASYDAADRLEQIKKLTGYDPQRFEHAMLLQFALWLTE